MRDYGLEHLAERGDLDRMQRQHASHYLEFAEHAAPNFVGADEGEWFDRVDGELANLRAALAFLRDSGDVAGYLRLAEALGHFWHVVGLYREGFAWLTSALAIGPAAPSRRRAESLALAGNMAILLDRYDEAFALLDDSIACSTHCGETPRPTALLALGLAALVQNRTEDACRYSEEAIAVARDDGLCHRQQRG
jgi:tetratricopeptide (TPR) repeat protein